MHKSDIKEAAKSIVRFFENLDPAETPKVVLYIRGGNQDRKPRKTYAGQGSPRMVYLGYKDGADHYEFDTAEVLGWLNRRWPWWRDLGIDGDWPTNEDTCHEQ